MSRTIEQIQQEYQMQCALLGDAHYKQKALEQDMGRMRRRLKELNIEGQQVTAEAQKQTEAPNEQT